MNAPRKIYAAITTQYDGEKVAYTSSDPEDVNCAARALAEAGAQVRVDIIVTRDEDLPA